ncbi:hypothetical protein [Phenylobacterium ferrooxidans]|uniref:DNA repair protein n=1 Tax=Phenylobacterium ferrooxidans TaxID=2982689 RepID=A0ABW6CK23_9CAUL
MEAQTYYAIVEGAARSAPSQALSLTSIFLQPAVVGAAIAGAVAGIGLLVNFYASHRLQVQRLAHEQALADRRFERDVELTDQKSRLDLQLADRRFHSEIDLADRKHRLDRLLEQWRRRLDWAEETLADFYSAAHAMTVIRFPGGFGDEPEQREGRDLEPKDLRAFRDTYFPVLKRLRDYNELLNSLHSKRFRAAAMFGPAATEPFDRFHQVVVQVTVGAQALMRSITHSDVGTMPAHKEKMEKRVWEGLEDPDPIAKEVEAILSQAEKIFSPVLSEAAPSPAAKEPAELA